MPKPTEVERNALRGRLPILGYFEFGHLPPKLQAVSQPLADIAWEMAATLPINAELSTGLRKLLEAKDCFVRAALDGKSHLPPEYLQK
jgi:hypothetical protein